MRELDENPNTTMSSVSSLMLTATELFHYSYKFREQNVVIVLESHADLLSLLSDFRVLSSSHVQATLCLKSDNSLQAKLEQCNVQGHSFKLVDANQMYDQDFFQSILRNDQIPVVHLEPETSKQDLISKAFELAETNKAIKLFYVQSSEGLVVDGRLLSHPSIEELDEVIASAKDLSVDTDLLNFICNRQRDFRIDVGIIQNSTGALFRELFTHRGSGTLLSFDYKNYIRSATLKDVSSISLLLSPYVQNNLLLPITDNELASSIDTFNVYTVNEQIVAAARMKDYEDAAELGKFCTLPRYQRRGRARILALSLIDKARINKKSYVFALSIEPSMWNFFLALGFEQCTYEELPLKWQMQYDRSRNAKAFKLDLI